ncbi:MAG TPA: S8 family serine peptidase [Gemmatimonadales bacterium]|nr:S8 family serine peptidase [Gemmatimonadales bacterium]
MTSRRFFLALALAAGGLPGLQAQEPVAPPGQVSRAGSARTELERLGATPLGARAALLAVSQDPVSSELSVDVLLRARPGVEDALRAARIRVGTRVGQWLTARVPLSALPALARTEGVLGVDLAYRAYPTVDSGVVDIGVAGLRQAIHADQFEGKTGRGVIIGIVDTGLDFTHPDFVEDDTKQSRVLYLWDQTFNGNVPGDVGGVGFWYGHECGREALTTGACESRDAVGHGTHVAGIAAGDGSSSARHGTTHAYTGVAPGAELIVVKTDFSFGSVLDGVYYVFKRAEELGRPAVVNLSLGAQIGPHDGLDAVSLILDALTGPGRIVVASAGNDGLNPTGTMPSTVSLHAEGAAAVGDSVVFELQVSPFSPGPWGNDDLAFIQAYFDPNDQFDVTVIRPNGTGLTLPHGAYPRTANDVAGAIRLYSGTQAGDDIMGSGFSFGGLAGDSPLHVAQIYLGEWTLGDAFPAPGTWRLVFRRVGGTGPGTVDAWIPFSTLNNAVLFTRGASNRKLVGIPGGARSVITVGAHSSRTYWTGADGNPHYFLDGVPTGELLAFSSPGPMMDGRLKPDLTAPGRVQAARSRDAELDIRLIDPDTMHVLFQGTSMSAPHVTGAVALLLAQRPTLTPDEVRDILQSSARGDQHTARRGPLPNPLWGAGKLDVPAALAQVGPTPGRAVAAGHAVADTAASSRRGTRVPLQLVRIGASDAESLSVVRVGVEVSGRDQGFRLLAVLDLDRDGAIDEGEPVAAAGAPVALAEPTYLALTIPTRAVVAPMGGSVDLILAADVSGATPNGDAFAVRLLPDSGITVGLATGRRVAFSGKDARATVRTTVLAADERINLSENPVRRAELTINFPETARSIELYDFGGRRIRRLAPAPEDRSARWDLRDARGGRVAPGAYLLVVDLASGPVRRTVFVEP